MLEKFAEKTMEFMLAPNKDKKEELKKLYNEIKNSEDVAEDRLKSVEEVYGYVEWVLSN